MPIKAVILAGGLGTRLSEETVTRPKPMVEIGEKPILWHIMKIYSTFGINDFVICLGYKGYVIKEYFANYYVHNSDITFDLDKNKVHIDQGFCEPWKVTLVDTGQDTLTGGRIRRIRKYVEDDEFFCLTYGDGVADINVDNLISFHVQNDRLATLTAVQPPGRFGALDLDDVGGVRKFLEKPQGDGGYINGGFFVLSPKVMDYIEDDTSIWERDPLERLSADSQLSAFTHNGFWQPMDTLRDKEFLSNLWMNGDAPWKIW